MKKYITKKRYVKNNSKNKNVKKLYISVVLFCIIILVCSLKIPVAQNIKNYISYNLRNNVDFGSIAQKTGKFAVECLNYYKNSDAIDILVEKDGGPK